MKALPWLGLVLLVCGCQSSATHFPSSGPSQGHPAVSPKEEAEIRENLSKLSPEDRKLAEAQKFCAVETDSRLGAMDVPFKLEIQGEPVFLCCEGCKKQALAHPDRTLARVRELRAQSAATSAR